MLKQVVVMGVIWTGIAATMWLTLVPSSISVTTFAWLNAALAVAFVAVAGATRSARPTSSVAQVLYDVEHPSDIRR
jgi:hypothetical protein